MYKERIAEFSNGTKILNCTPHEFTFMDSDGTVKVVEKCGATLPSEIVDQEELKFSEKNGRYFRVRVIPTMRGLNEIKAIKDECGDGVIIIGSILSNMAYPEVFSTAVVDGYFRMDFNGAKVYSIDKFSKFCQGGGAVTGEDKISTMLLELNALKNKVKETMHSFLGLDSFKRKISLLDLAKDLERLEGLQDSMLKSLDKQREAFEGIKAALKQVIE